MHLRHPNSVAHVRLLVRAPWKRYVAAWSILASRDLDHSSIRSYPVNHVVNIGKLCWRDTLGIVRMLLLLDVLGLLDKVAAFFVAYYACSFKLWSDTVSWLDLMDRSPYGNSVSQV